MKKILSYLKTRQYLIATVALAVILIAANVQRFVKADETQNTSLPPETVSGSNITTGATTTEVAQEPYTGPTPINLVHANCIKDLEWGTNPSTTYNSNSPYNLSFVIGDASSSSPQGLNGFYDINGDNLPDYVYSLSYTGSGGNVVESNFEGCVYLNNGNGWTRAFRCKAHTYIENGQITTAQYWGDCAGQ